MIKLFHKSKDGGLESTVTGYWLIEWKQLFSIVLLKFEGPSRKAFHTHAFNSLSWLIKGFLVETFQDGSEPKQYLPSIFPFTTLRDNFHRVDSIGISYVLSFRGPWSKTWLENTDESGTYTLSDGRVKLPTITMITESALCRNCNDNQIIFTDIPVGEAVICRYCWWPSQVVASIEGRKLEVMVIEKNT
jgi:hypothetical protein